MALKDIFPKKTNLSKIDKTNISMDYKNSNNLQKTSYDTFETYQQTLKGMFGTVIKPEERKIKNYLNINFWLTKYSEYKKLREKEKEELGIYETLSYGARPSIEYY